MNLPGKLNSLRWVGLLAAALWFLTSPSPAQPAGSGTHPIRIVEMAGTVEISLPPGADWVITQTNQLLRPFYRLRTGPNSRAALLWSDQSILPVGPLTELEILPPHARNAEAGLHLVKGILSFFHRDKPGRIRVITAGATAGIEGTEFVVEVASLRNVERTTLSVIDGQVAFGNDNGNLTLTNGQQAIAVPGQPPVRTAGFLAENILQWALYYPAVLDVQDLPLTSTERDALGISIAAYRSGDLLAALAAYPADRQQTSDAEKLYHAALLLAVGQVANTEAILQDSLPPASPLQPLATALRTLIAAVKRPRDFSTPSPRLASELMAASYHEQSRATGEPSLKRALALAQQAAAESPEFGFAWARVAELQFGFGRLAQAEEALRQSLALAPRNAQALALDGFLLAAKNHPRAAIESFHRALAVDSALGNAWLGRGLCRIRLGDRAGGREDLLIAAALEPQRSLLRSYLAKAWSDAGDTVHSLHELDLARRLDPADPTAWLYAALLKQRNYRFNEAIEDLEASQELNDNRRLYRSELLLDQDRAVRGANLARLYQDAGMTDVAVREAARAVSADYANYSAHLFLAESFDALRDPTRFDLRQETVWFNELLLANLLAPVGGTPLSQNLSQQEYSRLFERDRLGLAADTSYRSDGQYRALASHYGTLGKFGYALDLDYQHNDGVRPNNELDRIEWYSTFKYQLTWQDSLMLLTKYQDYSSGDNFQYYDPTNARPNFQFEEYQKPIALLAYHRAWQPGMHTLFLGGRLENDQRFSDRAVTQTILEFDSQTNLQLFPVSDQLDIRHRVRLEIYTFEAQQIFENDRHSLLFGGRWQGGEFDTSSEMTNPVFFTTNYAPAVAGTRVVEDFQRSTLYAYETLKLPGRLRLTGGLTYERLEYPENFRSPPIQPGEETRERLNPKAALVWEVLPQATLRGAYGKSLAGVSLDESFGLEPRQLAGFSQAFRTLIPESLAGSVAAWITKCGGAALDLKFKSRTYVGIQGENLQSQVHRSVGVFEHYLGLPAAPDIFPANTREYLDYRERNAGISVNQLVSDEWALGGHYSFTRSKLHSTFPGLQDLLVPTESSIHADLHRFNVFVLYNHPSGFFVRTDLDYYLQTHSRAMVSPGVIQEVPDECLPQLGIQAGFRFPRQLGDITLGVLNLTDEDYRLNPVTPYSELPRERVLMARLRLKF